MKTTEDHLPFLITAAQLVQAANCAPSDMRKDLAQRAKDCLAAADAIRFPLRDVEPFPTRHYQPQFTEESLRAAGAADAEPDSLPPQGGPAGTLIDAAAPAGANAGSGPFDPGAPAAL